MKKTLITVVLLWGFAAIAEGADWIPVSESPDGKKWFVDKKSIRCLPSTIKAKVKKVEKTPQNLHNRSFKEVIFLNEFDRKQERLREIQVEILFTDGSRNVTRSKGDWMNIMRGSMYESAYKYLKGVCK